MIRVEQRGETRVLTISNPARKGAVTAAMLEQLALEAARPGARCLVLAGEPKTFCAGYDLSALPDTPAAELPDAVLGRACAALEESPAPVIAAIGGAAFGAGFELAAACDFRVAAPGVKLALPPAKLGLVYSPEGSWRVLRAVGLQKARALFLRATTYTSEQLPELVDELAEDPLARALALAEEICALAPQSIAGLKRTLAALTKAPLDSADRAALEDLRRRAFSSQDAKEGRDAFLQRRPPKWSGA